jgi:hypothetical protein
VEWDDFKTPAIDIYLQEFFMYAYSFITKDRKGFFESSEGRTFVRSQVETRHSKKVFDMLYGDHHFDKAAWHKKITDNK